MARRCAPFSQLLDDLTYTRSRNSKLKLIGDYLKETPDPDRGIALAALTGTLDIAAVKPAQIRAMAEERIDPILLYMSRDYVGDMAETVSLLWPNPEGERCELDDGTLRISDIVERLRTISRSDAPAVLADMLDRLDASGRFRPDQACHRGAPRRHFRAPCQAGAGRRLRARRRAGRGSVARAEAALLRAVRLGRGAGTTAHCRGCTGIPAVHACASVGREPRFARRICRRMEMGRHSNSNGPCRRANPPLQPNRGRYQRQLSRHRLRLLDSGRARRRATGAGRCPRRRCRQLQCAAAAARPEGRQREVAGPISGLRPALRHIVRRRRGFAAAGLDRAPGAAGGIRASARSGPVRSVRPDRSRQVSRRSKTCGSESAAKASKE